MPIDTKKTFIISIIIPWKSLSDRDAVSRSKHALQIKAFAMLQNEIITRKTYKLSVMDYEFEIGALPYLERERIEYGTRSHIYIVEIRLEEI